MTKQEAEPIILNLFYRDTGPTRTNLTPREQEAAYLWKWQEISFDDVTYVVIAGEGRMQFLIRNGSSGWLRGWLYATFPENMGDTVKV